MALSEILTRVPTSIGLTEGRKLGFIDLFESLRRTPAGQKLAERTRYNQFKRQGVGNSEWEEALGADANNFEHMRLLYGLTRDFIAISGDYFTEYEKEILLLAAIVHDMGEYKYGDVPSPLKTKFEEGREMAVLREVLIESFPQDEIVISQVVSVVQSRGSKVGRAFNAIERIGYVRTALRAWREFNSVKWDGKLHEGLFDVSFTFLDTDKETNKTTIEKLIEYSNEYKAVKLFLDMNMDGINQIFQTPLNPKAGEALFQRAKDAWLKYLNLPLPLGISSPVAVAK